MMFALHNISKLMIIGINILSLLIYKGISELKSEVLIINTTGMLEPTKEVLSIYDKAYLFLDNAAIGIKATESLSQILTTKNMNYM